MAKVIEVLISEGGPEIVVGYVLDNNFEQLNKILETTRRALAIDFNKLPLQVKHENGIVRRISRARLEGTLKSIKPEYFYKGIPV